MCWGTKCTETEGALAKLNFDAQTANSKIDSPVGGERLRLLQSLQQQPKSQSALGSYWLQL